MEVIKNISVDHDAYYVHNILCRYNTFLPLQHFVDQQGGDVNLVMYNETSMFLEKCSATTLALIVLYSKDAHAVQDYADMVADGLEADVLPSQCNAQLFRSVLYLPLFMQAPDEYTLTAPRVSSTVFQTPLPCVMAEWTRTFCMLQDGSVVTSDTNLDAVFEKVQTPMCPADVLDQVLEKYFK